MSTEHDDLSMAALVVSSVLILMALLSLWWKKHRGGVNGKWIIGVMLVIAGASMAIYLAVFWETKNPNHSCTGAAPGTVPISGALSDYGIGPDKHMIVIDLTEIGGPYSIDRDEKQHSIMSTYANGTLVRTQHIGIEIKGAYSFDGAKIGLSVETWDADMEDTDTLFSEFGFVREYEDYVIRREEEDSTFVLDGALFAAQPEYYESTLVEVIFAVDGVYYYEGVYYFVNNPAKKDSIPGSTKFKTSKDVDEPTYILEWEYDASTPCNLTGHPHVECKYPKPSKLAGSPHKLWLEDLMTWTNASQLDWPSLADNFLSYQLMLNDDMQDRSMIYHILDGKLNGGPIWDAEPPGDSYVSLTPMHEHGTEWLVWDDSRHMDWWKSWLTYHPVEFGDAIRSSTVVQALIDVYKATDTKMRAMLADGEFDREYARWKCVEPVAELDRLLKWYTARADWMSRHTKTFHANDVTYAVHGQALRQLAQGAAAVAILGVIVLAYLACKSDPAHHSVGLGHERLAV